MVRMNQGQLPGALAAFNASIAISSKLAHTEPANVARQVAWSRTLAFVGLIHYEQGELDGALRNWQTAHTLLQPALKRAPDSMPLLEQLVFLDNDIAHVLDADGQPHAALAIFQERLQLATRLARAKPHDSDYVAGLGAAHNDLGKLALQRGDLATTIAEYLADDAIETRLLARDPKDNTQRDNMLATRAVLGRTLLAVGNLRLSEDYLNESVAGYSDLTKHDPGNDDDQRELGLYSSQLARTQRLSGAAQAAASLSAKAVAILANLTRKSTGDDEYRLRYAEAMTEQAAEAYAGGSKGAARKQGTAALAILGPMLSKHPNRRDTLLATVTAKLLLASVMADPKSAQSLREQSLQAIQATKVNQDDPRLLALEVHALLTLDRTVDARPLIERLWHEGYCDPGFVALLKRNRIAYPMNVPFAQKIATVMKTARARTALQAGADRVAGDTTTHR